MDYQTCAKKTSFLCILKYESKPTWKNFFEQLKTLTILVYDNALVV